MGEAHALGDALEAKLTWWAEASGCRLLVLFGSSASTAAPRFEGDVDLAVWFRDLPRPEERLAMIGQLQDLVHPRRADVVFLRTGTDPVLRFEIFRGGVPLFEAHDGLFVDETVRALALYEDALPFRRALVARLRDRERP